MPSEAAVKVPNPTGLTRTKAMRCRYGNQIVSGLGAFKVSSISLHAGIETPIIFQIPVAIEHGLGLRRSRCIILRPRCRRGANAAGNIGARLLVAAAFEACHIDLAQCGLCPGYSVRGCARSQKYHANNRYARYCMRPSHWRLPIGHGFMSTRITWGCPSYHLYAEMLPLDCAEAGWLRGRR